MERNDDRLQELVHALFIGAVRDGNFHTVHALLSQGADPTNEFAFAEAAAFGHAEILRLLLSAGAGIPTRAHNDSAICAAAGAGHAEAVRVLLQAGADFSVHNHGPLRCALANGHAEVARILREAGSYNPEAPGEDPVARHRESLLKKSQP